VPLAEIYSSTSSALHAARLNEIESWGAGVTPAFGGPQVGGVTVLPAPHNLGSWLGFEQTDPSITIPDARFGVNMIRDPAQWSGS